jgi:CelD/BcsL family acetyltransferase involved in cellulose biosynthesis
MMFGDEWVQMIRRLDDSEMTIKPAPAAVMAAHGVQAGRQHRRRDCSTMSVSPVTTFTGLEAFQSDWRELYERSGSRNPFASPDWLVPWARHFLQEQNLVLLAVRRGGVLVGVAPWYLRRIGPLRLAQLIGSGRHDALTELPQVLAAPSETRSVLRAVVEYWSKASRAWNWLELPMLAEQGWFEPEWLTGALSGRGFVQHKVTRPTVVLPLPAEVPALHRSLKRNLRESVHRARNRLDRMGRPWEITTHAELFDLQRTLAVLARLHCARAELAGPQRHPNQLAEPGRLTFLAQALTAMARRGQAEILTLDVEGVAVAAQLVLRAPEATYLGVSGLDPAWWDFSPVTLLQLRAAESAVERGHAEFNLSTGPGVAKLRWGGQVRQHPEFIVCGPLRRSRAAFAAYRAASAAAAVRREAARHQALSSRTDPVKPGIGVVLLRKPKGDRAAPACPPPPGWWRR